MILFKCRADYKVGWGHLMRCASIAQEINKTNKKTYLYCFNGKKILKKIGINPFTKYFNERVQNNSKNTSHFLDFLKKKKIKKVIIDDPQINSNIRNKIQKIGCKIIQLNYDFKNFKNIDILINHLVKNESVSKQTRVYKGPKYLIIRKNLTSEINKLNYASKDNLLLTFGASINSKIIQIINNLLKSNKLNIYKTTLILPSKKFEKYIKVHSQNKIKIYINPSGKVIKKLYKISKVGICAGGLQLSEWIVNRVIPIALSKNKKEKKNISFFQNSNLCHQFSSDDISFIDLRDKIIRKIENIYKNKIQQKNYSLDNLGAFRASKIILSNN